MIEMIVLDQEQQSVIEKLKSGMILYGGVGSGKSRTALAYFVKKECKGTISFNRSGPISLQCTKDLYIITTARKRDTLEWEDELLPFDLSTNQSNSLYGIKVTIDSWNNIKKYIDVTNAFFIFDEQRLVGNGAWVKSFLKISKSNNWIILTATPGDSWIDLVPVFIANGFFKNRTQFIRDHVIYSRFAKYPKIERYVNVPILQKFKQSIIAGFEVDRNTVPHHYDVKVNYDSNKYKFVMKERWNIYQDKPIQQISEMCVVLRRIVNSDDDRLNMFTILVKRHSKSIVFYNFNYELDLLKTRLEELDIPYSEWNGHKHEPIQKTKDRWVYLVQYTAGAEGWNCTETNTMIFYSQNYSYKIMSQAYGRIDRRNTSFIDLYYYHLYSSAPIDLAINRALSKKKTFNESAFMKSFEPLSTSQKKNVLL